MPTEQPKEKLETKPNEADALKENTPKELEMKNISHKEAMTETLRRKPTPYTAVNGFMVRKVRRKDSLFRVRESQSVPYLVDSNAKTCTCPDFTQQGAKCPHIEVVENIGEIRFQRDREHHKEYHKIYYQENKEVFVNRAKKYQQDNKKKVREYAREYWRRRYHKDPEYREKQLEADRKERLKQQEDYKRFKTEMGGKCIVCGNDNLNMLTPHHPHGKKEKDVPFIQSKEFRDWRKYGIKPDVVLMCANHHLEYETAKARGEIADIADYIKHKNNA